MSLKRNITVAELIQELEKYNPNATVAMVAYNTAHRFSIAYGHNNSELTDALVTPQNCNCVAFYLDDTKYNDNERGQG